MKYISEGSAAIARSMERKLQLLSPEAGIIFISIKPEPVGDGICNFFAITVGVDRTAYTNETTYDALVRAALKKEIHEDVIHLSVTSIFGVTGSCKGREIKVV